MTHNGVRIADDATADRLWPTIKAAHLFKDRPDYDDFRARAPWRVLAGPQGTAAVLERWRDHLDIVAIRALWAAPSRVSGVIDSIERVAHDQGFGEILSPLVPDSSAQLYSDAGFAPRQRIVVLRATRRDMKVDSVPAPSGVTTRLLVPEDIVSLTQIDAACFDEFWRYEPHRMIERLAGGRAFVAESDAQLIGYTHATIDRGSGTIGRLAVVDAERRGGVGTALLVNSMHFLFRAGVGAVSLCTQEENAASRALYSRVGLREMPERLVFLTKTLSGRGSGMPRRGDTC